MSTTPLPLGWTITTPSALKWTSQIIVQSDAFAIRDGLNWVAVSPTGVVTMQGKPIASEHFEALAHLQSSTPSGVEGGSPAGPVVAVTEPGPGAAGVAPAQAIDGGAS